MVRQRRMINAVLAALLAAMLIATVLPGATPASAQVADPQSAVVSEDLGYINMSQRGGPPSGPGVDGDGPPPLQPASLSATFSNFEINGISYDDWATCRAANDVQTCLETLVADTDGDGTIGLRELHPGAIGGDTMSFDVTITNTSPDAVLTAFAWQSKFSESPALASRIGDKLFSAELDRPNSEEGGMQGVKKNGVSNGLLGGKVKSICIDSSTDYLSELNLGTEDETLECAGGRVLDDNFQPVLQAADGDLITEDNIELPMGMLPGESQTVRIVLDAGTDDGALQRAHGAAGPDPLVGPLVGTLANSGQFRAPELASECLELNVQPGDNVLDVVNFGDVKIIRDAAGNCAPSFDPFSENQFLTVPRRNWGFSDILDTRDDYLPGELPTVLTGDTGAFSMLDFDNLREGELNLFEIMRGFGEHGETFDPSCADGGSRAGSCGGEAYVPHGEFYAVSGNQLIRQEVAGTYDPADYSGEPTLTATVDTGGQTSCTGPGLDVRCKTTDPFEVPGQPNPGPAIGGTATATFTDVQVISDDKTTVPNEGGRAGGDKVQVTVNVTNTSPAGSGILLTAFNWQSKQRGLTDINDNLDGTSILGRQDLRLGADGTLEVCGDDPAQVRCFDEALGIGRFPNVLGNSLLSATPISGLEAGKLESVKKNGTFQPLKKTDLGAANFICLKSGPAAEDQDADETCFGQSGSGLAPGDSQSVTIELDYGDFRGLILRVAPGTLVPQDPPFGLLALGGDFDCRDQRRLPYCHPDLVGSDWFTSPTALEDIEFVTVHQPGDAPTVMNFAENFGALLAMGGFAPTAEFYQGDTQVQVQGAYCFLPGGVTAPLEDCGGDPGDTAPQAAFTFDCDGLECTFDASASTDDGSITAYDWNFDADDAGAPGSGVNPTHTYVDPGTYRVELTVTDDGGQTSTVSQNVTVSADQPPAASFTFDCSDLACDFDASASSDPGGSALSYDWSFGDGAVGSGVTTSHTYAAAGDYSVTLTVTNADGLTNSETRNVTVTAPGGATITLDAVGSRFRGLQKADLTWTGASGTNVDIRRNGSVIATTANDGAYRDNIDQRGRGTYTYQVCETGNGTCSNEDVVDFN